MLPRFSRHHLIWIVAIVIAILYIFAPTAGVTLLIRQCFHVALTLLLALLG
jgi:hypothetical protein